jgi:phosphoribosylformylglycinamidine synthase
VTPYRGAAIAIAEASRNLVCSGAEPAGVTDCLNFGNPKKPERFWQFVNCIKGLIDACKFFKVPVVSGNVSFYNESPKGAINPTPTIGMVGVIEDINNVTKSHFKIPGCDVILAGETKEELGGSEYLKEIHGLTRGDCPELDLELERKVQDLVLKSIQDGLVVSAHDCSEGGLAAALAECCISYKEHMVGALITGLDFNFRKDAVLFGESQSRIILSVKQENTKKILAMAEKNNVQLKIIGKTHGAKLCIKDGNKNIIDLSCGQLASAWRNGLLEKLLEKPKVK